MKNKVNFWLGLVENQIDSWYEKESEFHEGFIHFNQYQRIKYLIWLIGEELNKKRGVK